jgi:hypothetical protein
VGKDGDTEFPFPPDDVEAVKHARGLFESGEESFLYIVRVFDNGQMVHYEFDPDQVTDLSVARKAAADTAFVDADFDGQVKDFVNDWDVSGDDVWTRKVYWEDDGEDGYRVGSVRVEFKPGTAEVIGGCEINN